MGLAAAVGFLVAFALPAPLPSPDAPASELISFLQEHRGRLLASSLLIALSSAPLVWFLCALARWLGAGERAGRAGSGASAAVLATGSVGTAVLLCGGALQSALVLQSVDASPQLIRLGFDAANSLVTIAGAGFGASVVAAGVAGARGGTFTAWATHCTLLVGAMQFATLGGLAASSGLFAAGGPLAGLAFLALSGWVIAVSVRVARGP